MLNGRNLVLDTLSEVYGLLLPWRTHEFWNYASHQDIPESIYVFGRAQLIENLDRVRDLCHDPRFVVVFGDSAEGSTTIESQLRALGLEDLVMSGKMLLISGGEQDPRYHYIHHEHFLIRVLDYEENLQEISRSEEIFTKKSKPYKFLYLNGRSRPHRKYLWERFRTLGILDHALCSMLDGKRSDDSVFSIIEHGQELMRTNTPIQLLPDQYEVPMFRGFRLADQGNPQQNVKNELFQTTWGDIYLQADAYIDTYFSLVTETVFETHYSFRTEKIAKPLAMAHPWIAATNAGFYRDIRNLGFQSFDTLIDESFDTIDDHRDRMDRIVAVVQDLCDQDLDSFVDAAKDICKYNQQHLQELIPDIKKNFPGDFFRFVEKHRPCKI
jgi:hypothetical protein